MCSRCGHIQLTSLVLTFSVTSDGQQLPLESSLFGRWQVRSVRGKMLPGTTLNQNLELGVHMSQLPHLSGEMTLRSLSQLLPNGPCRDEAPTLYLLSFFPDPLLCTPAGISQDHLQNKLLALESLSQSFLLGEPKLRHHGKGER